MPTPAHSAKPTSKTADTHRPDGSWYSDITPTAEPARHLPGYTAPPADVPGPATRGAEAPGQAQLSRQYAELDRLARENERLMVRIDTLLHIQEREQVLRQQLQNQFEHIKHSASAADLDAVRREARAGVTEELKPVLLAILNALERFAHKPAPTPVSPDTAASSDPFFIADYGKLPAILTRPLDELVADGDGPGRSGREAKK